MMKNGLALSFLAIAVSLMLFSSFAGCLGPSPPPMAKPDINLTNAHNDFAFNLTHQLVKSNAGKNIFISPTSISMALSMVYEGAQGTTRSEMEKTLGYDGLTNAQVDGANAWTMYSLATGDSKVRLDIANSLWMNKDFSPRENYTKAMETSYQAKIQSLDFNQASSSDTINSWVGQKTNGKITRIIDASTLPQSRAVLINAIYFNGDWTKPFEKRATRNQDFHLADNSTVSIPLMSQKDRFFYTEDEQMQVIRLPYGNESTAMYVFLPLQNASFNGIDDFVRQMNTSLWNQELASMTKREGYIALPSFKMDYSAELKPPLQELGIRQAFALEANFSGISQEPLYISSVLHKTYVLVDEQGTEAAAATSVNMVAGAAAPPRDFFIMTVDRPFLFAIQDERSGEILFMGVVENPAK